MANRVRRTGHTSSVGVQSAVSAGALAAVLGLSAHAHAQTPGPTQSVRANADTTLRLAIPYGNDGTGSALGVTSLSIVGLERTLIRVDQSQILNAVGTGRLSSAQLTLTVSGVSVGWNGGAIEIRRMTRDWPEGGGTNTAIGAHGPSWRCADDANTTIFGNLTNDCTPQNLWGMDFLDFLPLPFSSTVTDAEPIFTATTRSVTFDVTADVRAFLNGQTNYGWMIKGTDSLLSGTWVNFGSRETATPPMLRITAQQPVDAPPTIAPPAATTKIPLATKLKPSALPLNTRGQLPGHSGDSLILTFKNRGPVTQQTATDVRDNYIAPTLTAIGFTGGTSRFRMPAAQGVTQSSANLAVLAEDVRREYVSNPGLVHPYSSFAFIDALKHPDETPTEPFIDKYMRVGEGMTFRQYVDNTRRLEIYYMFPQIVNNIAIEHVGLLATRYEGQTVTSVRGTVVDPYTVANTQRFSAPYAISFGASGLLALSPNLAINEAGPIPTAATTQLVFVPYGSDAAGVAQLRYAYRFTLGVLWRGRSGHYDLWVDADTGAILEAVAHGFETETVQALVFDRDPDHTPQTMSLNVDPLATPSGTRFAMQRSNLMSRVQYGGTVANGRVESPSTNLVSAPFNSFGADGHAAECKARPDHNPFVQQISLFGNVNNITNSMLAAGIAAPFPDTIPTPIVDQDFNTTPPPFPDANGLATCNADSSLRFTDCGGYEHPMCPAFSNGMEVMAANGLNPALDATVYAHEVGHNITPRLTSHRPVPPGDPLPVGFTNTLHDLADAWGGHFTSTDCTGGYMGKNVLGVNVGLNCAHHFARMVPRRMLTPLPFTPVVAANGVPAEQVTVQWDHFPEHRRAARPGSPHPPEGSDHADGNLASAALWYVRQNMRSRCRPSGTPQYLIRWVRAMKKTGFLKDLAPAVTDLRFYRMMRDLEVELTEQWALSGTTCAPGDATCEAGAPAFKHNGPTSTNKVLSGFARVGLFTVPHSCIDGDAATACCQLSTGPSAGTSVCGTEDTGADAVIDADDNTTADDPIDGINYEVDYLSPTIAPGFHVWTGPRFRFAGEQTRLETNAPCNNQFMVQVSTDQDFPADTARTVTSAWTSVDVDNTTTSSPECYGRFNLASADYQRLQATLAILATNPTCMANDPGCGTRLYYRARTRDMRTGTPRNERRSWEPANGMFGVANPLPPPFLMITSDGKSNL